MRGMSPPSECGVASGVIAHKPSGRTTTFGKVADAAGKLQPPKDVSLKDPKDWKIAGKPLKRLDTVDKLTGKLVYGIDVKLPGMLNAAIKDCPIFGGRLKSFDAQKLTGMKGVRKVVGVGETGVAVVADTWWQAKTALDALPVEWDQGENSKISSASIAEWLKAGLDVEQAFVGNQNGDVKAAFASAVKEGGSDLLISLPEPRDDGADEHDGALHGRQMRGLVPYSERRYRPRSGDRGIWSSGCKL